MTSLSFQDSRGMTLVELLVVVVILGIMIAVLGKGVFTQGSAARARLNEIALTKVQEAVERYRLEYNLYPSSLEDLVRQSPSLKDSGKAFFPLIDEKSLQDVFGYPFVYRAENNNRNYSLKSLGSDGIEGGEGVKQDIEVHSQ
jgi:general secretion pathway protein G